MSVGKNVAGTVFKVTLEVLRSFKCFERNIYFQLPWHKLRGVIASARIVFGDALFQVGSVSNVASLRVADALNNIGAITLEVLRLFKSFERNIYFQLPWHKLRGVITSARIVFGDALFQVRGVSNVAVLRMADAFNNVGVIHHAIFFRMACHP